MIDAHSKINDFLTSLNIENNLSTEQKITRLNDIIDNELEKSEADVDTALVKKCLGAIKELDNGRYEIRADELDANLQKIKLKVKQSTTAPRLNRKPYYKKTIIKVAAGLAAALIVIFTSMSVAAKVSGYDGIDKWVDDHVKMLFDLGPGEHKIDGITVVTGSSYKEYESIEAFIKEEKLDILYPSALPSGVKVKKATMTFYEGKGFDISFYFDSPNCFFSVCNFDLYKYNYDSDQKIDINGCVFNIVESTDGGYQANYVSEKYAYTLVYKDYDGLIYILENLKGFES